ncbi:MAG: DUF885 family protein [Bacteroidetes bacterium]|nr:MAG: DUF885 family protein [Bacteroidota bacterium]
MKAEWLAWEMGMFTDDTFGNVGRLRDELFRANRLVVDTGIHYKRWTRDEAIDYLYKQSGFVLHNQNTFIPFSMILSANLQFLISITSTCIGSISCMAAIKVK